MSSGVIRAQLSAPFVRPSVTCEKRWKIFAQKWCVFGGKSESFGMSVILAAPWIQGVTVEESRRKLPSFTIYSYE
jgi:hypothetical protein